VNHRQDLDHYFQKTHKANAEDKMITKYEKAFKNDPYNQSTSKDEASGLVSDLIHKVKIFTEVKNHLTAAVQYVSNLNKLIHQYMNDEHPVSIPKNLKASFDLQIAGLVYRLSKIRESISKDDFTEEKYAELKEDLLKKLNSIAHIPEILKEKIASLNELDTQERAPRTAAQLRNEFEEAILVYGEAALKEAEKANNALKKK
jgi:hypothetical protein